jgi:succinate dehydrogenase / fumarate reductase cytochrome b subunit
VAATASPPVAVKSPSPAVAPLRAGQGSTFLLRRLHSLSGIFPVGAFLLEHFFSNAFALNGPEAYGRQVAFLTGLPLVVWLELFFIWLPLAFHSLYGFWIWHQGSHNLGDYPWTGNWMYAAQRWTGAVAFPYIVYHTYTMRFTGVSLFETPHASFAKVQASLFSSDWVVAFYVVGIIATCWHFAYGVWLFAAKWGLVTGPRARRNLGVVCFVLGFTLIVVGLMTLKVFFDYPQMPLGPAGADAIAGDYY